MTDGNFIWPRLRGKQRLILARPTSSDWREGLRNLSDLERGVDSTRSWKLSEPNYLRSDVLLTIFPTEPRLFACIERFTADANKHSDCIHVDPDRYLVFEHGVLVDPIEARVKIDLARTRWLGAADGNAVIHALQERYESGVGIFGDVSSTRRLRSGFTSQLHTAPTHT